MAVATVGSTVKGVKDSRDAKKERKAAAAAAKTRADEEKTSADLKARDERAKGYGQRTRSAAGSRSYSGTFGPSPRSFFAAG